MWCLRSVSICSCMCGIVCLCVDRVCVCLCLPPDNPSIITSYLPVRYYNGKQGYIPESRKTAADFSLSITGATLCVRVRARSTENACGYVCDEHRPRGPTLSFSWLCKDSDSRSNCKRLHVCVTKLASALVTTIFLLFHSLMLS